MCRIRSFVLASICVGLLLLGSLPVLATPVVQRDDELECEDDWASLESEEFPGKFKVWASCTGEYEEDLAETRELIERFWGPVTEFMGVEPVPDEGTDVAGGDPAIDFYLLNADEEFAARSLYPPGSIGAAAYARSVPPQVGVSSSGVIAMSREDLGTPFFYFVLIHEFFHVLQHARNTELGFNWDTRPDDDPDWDTLVFAEHWWTEATADWTAHHFTRDLHELDETRRSEHLHYFKYYLDRSADIPLHAPHQQNEPGWTFMYSAYIWFYFMEQEIGPEPVAEIWEEFAELGPNDIEEAMAIIDAKFPFEQHFREFAVRNLNLELEPGDPIDPSYDDLDPEFPVGGILTPPLIVGEDDEEAELPITEADEEPRIFPDRLRSLTAHYYRFLPDSHGGQLLFDFSGLTPAADLDVDVVMKIEEGEWERRRLAAGGAASFCLSDPEEEIEELYLILSNHNRDLFSVVEGEFTAQVLGEHCAGVTGRGRW